MGASSKWMAASPGKRWMECFILAYSPFWILWALCILVPFRLYDRLTKLGYLGVGLAAALPLVILPLILQPAAERGKPWGQRFWVKSQVWIAIFSFVGNYFWTHYFFQLLGAAYTFPSWRLNNVPITLYFMTHAYFCFYHAISNLLIRRLSFATRGWRPFMQQLATALLVLSLSYATAFMETLTIAHFPYYTFMDRSKMYTVGSLFYAIYFFVSFPMFYRIDEVPGKRRWTASEAALDALAASMLVTIVLDLWRISFGNIYGGPENAAGLPWMQ